MTPRRNPGHSGTFRKAAPGAATLLVALIVLLVSPVYSREISDNRWIRVDSLLQQAIDQGRFPHALTYVAQNGRVLHHKAFGWKNVEQKEPLRTDDIFYIYSQAKAITTVALMTLYEKGAFQLDDPVSRYIPECTDQVLDSIRKDGSLATHKARNVLTIRHLLCHSSGIGGGAARSLREKTLREQGPFPTIGSEVRQIIALPLGYEPGTQYNYHPSSDVWGYLVELFSGMSLRDYVRKTILEPLGMDHTDWYFDPSLRSRMVTGYVMSSGKLLAQDPSSMYSGRDIFGPDQRYVQAGSGLNGTIGDYARFCQMLLDGGTWNGKRILSPATIHLMTRNHLPYPNNGGNGFQFGLGFQIFPGPSTQGEVQNFTPMVSEGSYGWLGMYQTHFMIDPQEKLIVLLFMNRRPDEKIWERFLNTVYQAIE